ATRRLVNWAAAFEDGPLIRAAFFGLLTATGFILYLDYVELSGQQPLAAPVELAPILPAFNPDAPGGTPGPDVSTPMETLRQPLAVELGSGGALTVTGTIMPGSGESFAEAVESYGEYVTTVRLDSPGGSVADALEMGRLIRERGFSTTVAAGSLCASSCPLVFAGGAERIAAPDAAIAVHQIYAATPSDSTLASRLAAAGNAMSDAQTMTAEISRYLIEMGIDPEVWLRALETPPDRLSYFSPDDLTRLKLATQLSQ
ncbi:MAG TPA: hypothetical protein VFE52_04080, partial [Devosia sp.]|nr:hypothetical protein [Devosia sp.]